MKTLAQIKDEVAVYYDYTDWEQYLLGVSEEEIDVMTDEVAKRYAREVGKQALENAAKWAFMVNPKTQDTTDIIDGFIIDKESITSESNLLL